MKRYTCNKLPSYVEIDANGLPLVCWLNKVLYGLQQDPRAWFDKLKAFLISVGFVLSKSDVSLFIHITNESHMYVLDYVMTSLLQVTALSRLIRLFTNFTLSFHSKTRALFIIFWVLR